MSTRATMNQYRHFVRGHTPVFKCGLCGRNTRKTEGNGTDLCAQCFELAGQDNYHNDSGTTPNHQEQAEYDRLLAIIVERGGNGDAVKAACSFLFKHGGR